MTEPVHTVVVIEDESQVRKFLRTSLEGHGYRVVEADTGAHGMLEVAQQRADVVLLDLGLPDMDGIEVVQRLREWTKIPIIVVSARGQELDKVAALDAGADDYLTKPFGVGELLARVRVSLRHTSDTQGGGEPIFTAASLRIDLAKRQVFVDDVEVHLTPIEYRLLILLVEHAGKVITHRQLLREVWGPNAVEHTHYLRVHMANLRRKIEADPARPRLLLNEPGVGYRLRADE